MASKYFEDESSRDLDNLRQLLEKSVWQVNQGYDVSLAVRAIQREVGALPGLDAAALTAMLLAFRHEMSVHEMHALVCVELVQRLVASGEYVMPSDPQES